MASAAPSPWRWPNAARRCTRCDINAVGLAETEAAAEGTCRAITCDLGRPRRRCRPRCRGIDADILVNCAGGVRGQVGRPIEEITAEDWQAIFDANLSGTFFMPPRPSRRR